MAATARSLTKWVRPARWVLRRIPWGLPWAMVTDPVWQRRLWPLAILTALAGSRAWAITAHPLTALTAGLVTTCGVVVYLIGTTPDRAVHWGYTGCCLTGFTTGLVIVSLAGPARWVTVVGVLGWAAGSVAWWQHRPPQRPLLPPAAVAAVEQPVATSGTVADWNTYIRDNPHHPLTGARIVTTTPFEHGQSHTIELVRGRHHFGTAQAAMKLVSSSLDIPMFRLLLEPHPLHPERPTMIRMQEITDSPIKDTIYFDQPRHRNGRILLGPHADGVGEAWLRLYTEDEGSMHSTSLTGGTGLGKGRLIDTIVITALDMRTVGQHTVVFYMDGQNGASSPALYKNATWAVGTSGVMRMLTALERIAVWRQKENTAHGWTGFTPGADRPGILIVIDEAHLVITGQNAVRFANLAKSIRKLGMCLLVAAHDSSLQTLHNDSLRAALLGGNGIVMHVDSRIVGNLIPGCDTNPADLPKIPGYAIVVGAPGSGIRTAPYRGRYAPDEREKALAEERGTAAMVSTIESWFQRYPPLELDPGAANAAGKPYLERHTAAAVDWKELLATIHGTPNEAAADRDTAAPLQAATDVDQSTVCAARILDLDWDQHPVMDAAHVMAQLGTPLGMTMKALTALASEAGELVRDDTTRPTVYRRSGVAA